MAERIITWEELRARAFGLVHAGPQPDENPAHPFNAGLFHLLQSLHGGCVVERRAIVPTATALCRAGADRPAVYRASYAAALALLCGSLELPVPPALEGGR